MATFNVEKPDDHTLVIQFNGKEISRLNYNKFEVANRPFLFPVYTPQHRNITRHYPMETIEGETHDHPHHTGVWTAWGDINGVDNWAFGKEKGKQILKNVVSEAKPEGLSIQAEIEWTTPTDVPQLAEKRTILIHEPGKYFSSEFSPKATTTAFVYDFNVEFTTKFGQVKFGDTKEGGLLSVRVATALDVPKGGRIDNAQGGWSEKGGSEKMVWGKKAEWCAYTGTIDGAPVGVAILDHPKNRVHPTYWHVRNYGLMTANPFGKSHFVFPHILKGSYVQKAQETSTWRYRLVVFDGTLADAQLPVHYTKFIQG